MIDNERRDRNPGAQQGGQQDERRQDQQSQRPGHESDAEHPDRQGGRRPDTGQQGDRR